jgi:6 kDa early secretory antigenic target
MAGSEYTRVLFGSMEQGRTDLAASYSNLRATVDTLDAQLQTHLVEWNGAAQQAYHVAKAQWDTAMADMAMVLNQLGTVVGVAGENYSIAETTNMHMWGA